MTGNAFVACYIVAAIASILIGLYFAATPGNRSSRRPGRTLSPTEVGMLTSDAHAIAAALGSLRADGLIGEFARPGPDPSDRFTRAVYSVVRHGDYSRLRSRLRASLKLMRQDLIKQGLLTGDADRAVRRATAAPAVVTVVGAARFAVSVHSGAPESAIVAVMVVLVAATVVLRRFARTRRCTPTGRAELARLKEELDYLAPHMRPAYTTYGSTMAGMGAAIYGFLVIVMLDADVANAANLSRAGNQFFSLGGFGGDSSGGGCGSDGCRGGGCGGGGCGGGGCGGGGCGGGGQ
ncbi:TIGR04222 domain-containing membrane protein [Rhodococcoides trifolii]|nr:TIGR04222 domain-containing membrane protein [Rhodococcus trifolii]